MHEIGLMQEALERALKYAAQRGAQQIDCVTMRVGAESGVELEVIEFAFPVLAQGTLAEGARLAIEHVPVICWCPACDCEFEPADALHECPKCRHPGAELRRGREFEVASLEIS
jgi:hydrogenase nickel incorporation protein HypA/HybF